MDFSSPADSSHIACMLEMYSTALTPTQYVYMYDDDNSETLNCFSWNQCLRESVLQQNWFFHKEFISTVTIQ